MQVLFHVANMEDDTVDWDPDDVSVIQGEWHPRALELLRSVGDFAEYKKVREFRGHRRPEDSLVETRLQD